MGTKSMLRVLGAALLLSLSIASAGCGNSTVEGGTGGSGGGAGGSGGSGGSGGNDGCDLDGDGFRAANATCRGDDCNDGSAAVNPNAAEQCDGLADDDCDGSIDEQCPCTPGETRPCYDGPAATRLVGICADGTQECGADQVWPATCTGAVLPGVEAETCDGVDQDCDGAADQNLLNACGLCGAPPAERCGNSLDDDCNGVIDDGSICNLHCEGVDPVSPPPELACCVTNTGDGRPPHPEPYAFTCTEAPGLAACAARECLDLDGNVATACFARGYDDNGDGTPDRYVCGLNNGSADPAPSAACGYETPCARQDCDDRQNQPCYSGPPQTLGKGICRSGTHSCQLANGVREWTQCTGEVLPANEVCGDSIDNDCDGSIDEADGVTGQRCPGAGGCQPGGVETCGNGADDDCNGAADDGCSPTGASQSCYTGPAGTRGVGLCRDGTQQSQGEFWGPCEGETHPVAETCGDGQDQDCDGTPDDGCCGAGAVETCNQADDDCDGFVDEGVLNACGTCPGIPCYTEEFQDPASCDPAAGRTCNGVERDPNDPNAITLGQAQAQTPFIYIAVTGTNQVAKLDTVTGQVIWKAPSYGTWPSRTAVALDYSVWVGNRGFGCEYDANCSNLVHLSIDGQFICKADITGIVRAVAIDGEGNVWAGSYNNYRMYKIHGSRTQPGPDGLARCEFIDISPNDGDPDPGVNVGIPPYGAAIDGRGVLWTGSTPTVLVDTNNGTVIATYNHSGYYGVAIDRNNDAWFGGLSSGGPVHKLDHATGAETQSNAQGVSAVTVAQNGIVWGSGYMNNMLWRVDPANPMASQGIAIPPYGQSPHGVAEDGAGLIWSPLRYGGYAVRYDPVGGVFTTGPTGEQAIPVEVGQELYTYSDMTGSQLRTITTREGHWIQNFDAGYAQPDWAQVTWTSTTPPGTSVEVWVRSADTLAGLPGSPFSCGPYGASPASLAGCAAVDGHRYAAVEVILRSTADGVRPSVRDIRLEWSRP